jgi:5-methylcytosine-specific restriction enzyme B
VKTGNTDRVREYAQREYIEPARRHGDVTVRIVAGEVHKALGLHNRVPQVCDALSSRKFLEENHLVLVKPEGPPSGMSTTMTFTYRLLESDETQSQKADPLARFWGIGKEVFAALGGGEAFIRSERENFYGSKKEHP